MSDQCQAVLEGFDAGVAALRQQIIETFETEEAKRCGKSGSVGGSTRDGDPALMFFAWGGCVPLFQVALRAAVRKAEALSREAGAGGSFNGK